jgi:outer membrane protein OmpA-like peptidoglycan-associated protein
VITGSADKGTGSAKRNQYLSEQRAKAVKDYLVKAGVDESRISTKAVGDTDNRFNGAANNRVAVIELD